MNMADKAMMLAPEIIMIATAFVVMIVGLSPNRAIRKGTLGLSAAGLVVAGVALIFHEQLGLPETTSLALYVRLAVVGIGLLLLLMAAETPDEAHADDLHAAAGPEGFDPGNVARGEFYGFFLLSLVGAMLCATADDLIWLFLALELTSLPTYVMVATSREHRHSPEAGVKYFFLGAFAAALFLYGFALLYGATGTTMFTPLGGDHLVGISRVFAEDGINTLGMVGLLLAVVGVAFKIAAAPMHAYAADVYQGAATPVTAFLAFVPKTAGFVALMALIALVGWPLDATPDVVDFGDGLFWLLWVMAVATMFLGNTLALRQNNVKRVLAYSSIAHSGYMLVGVIAGPGIGVSEAPIRNGIAAVLFYLVIYGVMNLGAFAVLGVLKRQGEEAQTYDDLHGLAKRHPGLAAVMAISVFALAGLPPIVGFWGKLSLIGAALGAGTDGGMSDPRMVWLVVLLVIASAIAAVYYLRIIGACFVSEGTETAERASLPWRTAAAMLAAVLVIALSLGSNWLMRASHEAGALPHATATRIAELPH